VGFPVRLRTDRQNSLADLRTFQDWDLSYRLRAGGVAEVSSAGGFKQYQIG
jgi:Cu/Ag efflux pump CusA